MFSGSFTFHPNIYEYATEILSDEYTGVLWSKFFVCIKMGHNQVEVVVVAWLRRKAWCKVTRGFIPRMIQWHIHTGWWSLVNWWHEVLMRHYIRGSWILMRTAVSLEKWPRPWWWLVYPCDIQTVVGSKLSWNHTTSVQYSLYHILIPWWGGFPHPPADTPSIHCPLWDVMFHSLLLYEKDIHSFTHSPIPLNMYYKIGKYIVLSFHK